MRRWRLAARLARREVTRRRGRTALVATLVALPVLAMAVAVVLVRTSEISDGEAWHFYHGTADAVLRDPATPLPPGSRTVAYRSLDLPARTADGEVVLLGFTDLDLTDPIAEGIVEVTAGRLPTSPGEVALSPDEAAEVGVGIGDELSLARPSLDVEVVGLARRRECLDCTILALGAGTPWPLDQGATSTLVDLPELSRAELGALPEGLQLRPDLDPRPKPPTGSADDAVPWALLVGALVMVVVGIVIAAAFAVGARRQLVTLGQLAATGAPPAVLRAALVLQGTWTGLLGAGAGLALVPPLLAFGRSPLELAYGQRLGAWTARPVDLVAVVALGVGAATGAALIPARSAARLPTLAALAGRRPLAPVRRLTTGSGLMAMAAGLGLLGVAFLGGRSGADGTVWALVGIAGGVGLLLGMCAATPAVVAWLEPVAGRARGTARLAARSLARQRARTGAVVSAVAAASALAVAGSALLLGASAEDDGGPRLADNVVVASQYEIDATSPPGVAPPTSPEAAMAPAGEPTEVRRPPSPAATRQLGDLLPGAVVVPLVTAGPPGADWKLVAEPDAAIDTRALDLGSGFEDGDGTTTWPIPPPVVGSDEAVDAFDLPAEVRTRLEEVGAVVLATTDGKATLTGPDGSSRPAAVVDSDRSIDLLSPVLVSPDVAAASGQSTFPAALAYATPEPLTADQHDRLADLQLDSMLSVGSTSSLVLGWDEPPEGPSPLLLEAILAGLALLFSVLVVGTSLALAAAESRDERDVLAVAGLAPRRLARLSGAKAAVLAGLGAALAIPVGFLPVVVFARTGAEPIALIFPTRTVAIIALAVPAVAGAVAAVASAAAQRLRPVRISTAAFE